MPATEAAASTASAGSLLGELGIASKRVVLEHASAAQHRDDADADGLQEVGDVVVGQERQRVKAERAGVVLDEDAVEREGVQMRVQAQVRRDALCHRDGSALAAGDAAISHPS
ncbi:MAG: hypothetical protein R3B13_33685 [Polyangiaceae bacterium]